jgi:CRP-like cAMP-binding protein
VSTNADPLPSSLLPNKLLAALPAGECQRLLLELETTSLRPQHVLLKPHVSSNKIYFPGGGVCSVTLGTADGQVAGVAVVGHDGVIGLNAFGGDPESGVTATVIVDDQMQVMDRSVFVREIARRAAFADLIDRYTQAFSAYLMQSIVCNALHPVERRFARCLLDIRDRVGKNALPLTHAALASILGVRRATVTLCAGSLHRANIVEHSPKHFFIHDPARLENAACECYQTIKRHFARLLP